MNHLDSPIHITASPNRMKQFQQQDTSLLNVTQSYSCNTPPTKIVTHEKRKIGFDNDMIEKQIFSLMG